jgi:hypothetical protein
MNWLLVMWFSAATVHGVHVSEHPDAAACRTAMVEVGTREGYDRAKCLPIEQGPRT